ncbi:MAG: hypothetical protein KDK50_04090 [Chlamydiia bacterium]|nr:hypothetical protein [Chlamydiia bacterium]
MSSPNFVESKFVIRSVTTDLLSTSEGRERYRHFLCQPNPTTVKLFGLTDGQGAFSEKDVSNQLRKLQRAVHPDRNPDDETCALISKELNSLKDRLLDPVEPLVGVRVLDDVRRFCDVGRWHKVKAIISKASPDAFADQPILHFMLGIAELYLGNTQAGLERIGRYDDLGAKELVRHFEHAFKMLDELAKNEIDLCESIREIERVIEGYRNIHKQFERQLPWVEMAIEKVIPCGLFVRLKDLYASLESKTNQPQANREINLREAIRHCRTAEEKAKQAELIDELKHLTNNFENLTPEDATYRYFSSKIEEYKSRKWYSSVKPELLSFEKDRNDCKSLASIKQKLSAYLPTSGYIGLFKKIFYLSPDKQMYELLCLSEVYIKLQEHNKGIGTNDFDWNELYYKLGVFSEGILASLMKWHEEQYQFAIGSISILCKRLEDLSENELYYILAIMDDHDMRCMLEESRKEESYRMCLSPQLSDVQKHAVLSRYNKSKKCTGQIVQDTMTQLQLGV